jgi:xylulose-5-phosphate/fructose-6-phosphate phosphoketolase
MIVDSMAMQHSKWIEHAERVPWRADIPSLNYLLTSTCWRNDHNGFSHQGPGFIDTIIHRKPVVARVYLPPDANCLLSVADHCFRSVNYLNLIVIDKQPQLQWLTMDEARQHCARGASVWPMYSNQPEHPDIVLACAGDIPTQETIAAAWMLRQHVPDLKVRVVNVVDLMRLSPADRHPHGMGDGASSTSSRRRRPWSSPSTDIPASCTTCCMAGQRTTASMSAATSRRARPRLHSTWWC